MDITKKVLILIYVHIFHYDEQFYVFDTCNKYYSYHLHMASYSTPYDATHSL